MNSPIFRTIDKGSRGYLETSSLQFTGIDLLLGSEQVIGIGTTANPSVDLLHKFRIFNQTLRKTGDCVTLDYTENAFIRQRFATATENVNPFVLVINWVGTVVGLNPASDIWTLMKETWM